MPFRSHHVLIYAIPSSTHDLWLNPKKWDCALGTAQRHIFSYNFYCSAPISWNVCGQLPNSQGIEQPFAYHTAKISYGAALTNKFPVEILVSPLATTVSIRFPGHKPAIDKRIILLQYGENWTLLWLMKVDKRGRWQHLPQHWLGWLKVRLWR